MFTTNTHEKATRSWTSARSPEDTEARVRDALDEHGGQVRTTDDALEANFGSRWAMILSGYSG